MELVLASPAASMSAPPLTSLTDLPLAVLEHLLLFLPVSSLARLGATCTFLEQLIQGRFITNLEFPFAPSFLREVAAAASIDKKPVLRLTCHQATLPELSPTAMAMGLAFTSLHRLRDLVLLPDATTISTKVQFSCADLLEELGRVGGLQRLTELAIPARAAAEYFRKRGANNKPMPQPTKLLTLKLTASTKDEVLAVKDVGGFGSPTNLAIIVLPHVAVARKMRVEASSAFPFPHVEKLGIIGPCSLDFRLATPRLREVTTASWESAAPCTSTRLPAWDRATHRGGSCGVDVRWAWGNCPLLTSYNGVPLEAQGVEQVDEHGRLHVVRNGFGVNRKKWMAAAKAAFYTDYKSKGGEREVKAWAKVRWTGGKL